MVTESCVCKHEPCQAARSKHAGRFVTAPFSWTVGSIRPADIKLTEVIGEPAAGTMPRRCGDTLEEHYWFNQHGHGNLRMQARAVPGCMQQACGPFRRCIFHMDSRKQKTSIYQTNRGFRNCGGDDAEKVWGYARRALLVQPAWSRKPTYASRSRAKLHAASMRAVSSLHLSHGQSEANDQHISH